MHEWEHSWESLLLCGLREIAPGWELGQHGRQMNDHGIDADERDEVELDAEDDGDLQAWMLVWFDSNTNVRRQGSP